MTGFPINPPRARLTNPDGTVTNEWYRFFVAIQKMIGSGESNPFDDTALLTADAAMTATAQSDLLPAQLSTERPEPYFLPSFSEPGTLTAGTGLGGGGNMGGNVTLSVDTAIIGYRDGHHPFAYDYSTSTIVVRDGSSDAYHRHFGGIAEGVNGRLHLVYRRAAEHALTSGGTLYYSYSDDGGKIWSAETILVAAVAGFDQRSVSMCVTPTGRIVVIYDKVVVPSAAPTVIRMVYSDDNGATWVQGTDIATINFAFARAYGRIKLIPGDANSTYRLVTTPYYQSGSGPSTYRVPVWYSEDDGLTWAEGQEIVDDTTGYSETEIVAINALTWFAVSRSGSGLNLWKTTDAGATWASVGIITGTSSDSQVAPSLDKFERNGIWYLIVGYCDRSADDMRFKIANAGEALSSADAFGALMLGNTDMVNASGYQALVTKPDGTAYIDGGIAFVEFKEYVGFDYSQVRFVRLDLFQLAAESTIPKVLTVASGVVTMPVNEFDVQITLETESAAATDDLDTINGGREGQIVIFHGSPGTSARDVTLKNGTGNLSLINDFRINTTTSRIVLIKSGSKWYELARSNDHVSTTPALTIASGVVTVPSSRVPLLFLVGTEGGAGTDDLDTINGGSEGQIIICKSSSSSQDTTFKDGTGNLSLAGDFTTNTSADTISLVKQGSTWYEISRSDDVLQALETAVEDLDAEKLAVANNLSDVANAGTARTNLGLVAGGAGDIWVEKAGDTMTGTLILSGNGTTLRLSSAADAGTQQTNSLGFNPGTSTHTNPAVLIEALEFDASDSRASLLFYTRGTNSDAAATERFRIDSSGNLQMGGANTIVTSDRHLQLRSYTVAGLPAAGTAGRLIYVSNETGGAIPAFDDGTNWRRVTDRAVVS